MKHKKEKLYWYNDKKFILSRRKYVDTILSYCREFPLYLIGPYSPFDVSRIAECSDMKSCSNDQRTINDYMHPYNIEYHKQDVESLNLKSQNRRQRTFSYFTYKVARDVCLI